MGQTPVSKMSNKASGNADINYSEKNDTGKNRTNDNSGKNEEMSPKNRDDEKSHNFRKPSNVPPDDDKKHDLKTGVGWKHLLSGGTAGAVPRTCTTPLDIVKTYLQVHGNKSTSMKRVPCHMLKEGGICSMWRGNGLNALKIAPESALKFTAYEQTKRFIMRDNQTRELSLSERFVAGGFSQTMIYPLKSLDFEKPSNVPPEYDKKHDLKTGLWWKHLLAGGTAGAVSRTCTAPLDRVKTYLQVHGNKSTSMKGVLGQMLKEGGICSMWRGNGLNVLKIAPESALKFTAYEQTKSFIMGDNQTRELSLPERFVAGAVAGGFSQTMIYPLEVLKTCLTLRKTGEYKSTLDMAKRICFREGWRALYKGYLPHILGGIPYVGIDLAVYETLKNHWLRTQDSNQKEPSVMLTIACGSVSSTCGIVFTYPLLLVRTKLQAEAVNKKPGDRPMTMTSVFKKILKQEGAAGLYRGVLPNFMKVIPAISLTYVVYEKCKRGLQIP